MLFRGPQLESTSLGFVLWSYNSVAELSPLQEWLEQAAQRNMILEPVALPSRCVSI